jgi:CBS domain containing-hemolysin-like protein
MIEGSGLVHRHHAAADTATAAAEVSTAYMAATAAYATAAADISMAYTTAAAAYIVDVFAAAAYVVIIVVAAATVVVIIIVAGVVVVNVLPTTVAVLAAAATACPQAICRQICHLVLFLDSRRRRWCYYRCRRIIRSCQRGLYCCCC